MLLKQVTWQQGQAGVNLTGASATGLAPQRGFALTEQWAQQHWVAKFLPKELPHHS